MAEDYAAKMSRKTQAELLLYVQNYTEYREEAVLAALDELEARGLEPAAAHTELRATLRTSQQETDRREAQARQEQAEQELARRQLRGEEPVAAEAPTGPALYSPGTITIFSVLFSMVAGGIMLALNLRTLRRTGPALLVLLFIVVYLIGGVFLVYWLRQQNTQLESWIGSLFNLPAILVYNLYFWPRYIGGQPYRSREWLGPLLICGLVILGFYFWLRQMVPAVPV